jgi:serine O-acetyltransferase
MSGFRAAVRADLQRCLGDRERSAMSALGILWHDMGLQAVLVYRFGRLLRAARRWVPLWPLLLPAWLLYALAALWVRSAYGVRLALSADIGAGFWVGHFGGVEVVNCRLGERCSVGQQTKVGHAGDIHGPQIGDGVWIGAHARIVGPWRVGDGATIAPGARVTKNVPGRALVVGDPGRVVFQGYDNTQIMPRPHA